MHLRKQFWLGNVAKEDKQVKRQKLSWSICKSPWEKPMSVQYMIKYNIILPIWRVILDPDHFQESA